VRRGKDGVDAFDAVGLEFHGGRRGRQEVVDRPEMGPGCVKFYLLARPFA